MKEALKINPTATAVDAFLDAVPFASDKWGVFRTAHARDWMVQVAGIAAGTASATVFMWSDPTERFGYRRFRDQPRRHSSDAPQPVKANPLSGTKLVVGWPYSGEEITVQPKVVQAAPGRSGRPRSSSGAVEEEIFQRIGKVIQNDGIVRRRDVFDGLDEREKMRLNVAIQRTLNRGFERIGSGLYQIRDSALEVMKVHDPEAYERVITGYMKAEMGQPKEETVSMKAFMAVVEQNAKLIETIQTLSREGARD